MPKYRRKLPNDIVEAEQLTPELADAAGKEMVRRQNGEQPRDYSLPAGVKMRRHGGFRLADDTPVMIGDWVLNGCRIMPDERFRAQYELDVQAANIAANTAASKPKVST